MEQYIQMLIPAEPNFAPAPVQIAAYFEMLAESWKYEITWDLPYIHGLRVFKHVSKTEVEESVKATGMFPNLEQFRLKGIDGIPQAMEGLASCTVAASGNFRRECSPIKIVESAWPGSSKSLYCGLGCDLRPTPVLLSNWWTDGDHAGLMQFGEPTDSAQKVGIFTHPISRRNEEIPATGSARFWINFDFGEWLLPYMPEDFGLLDYAFIRATEDHFGVRMAQVGRALP